MKPFRTASISRKEWQWVVFWGGFLTILTMIPYAFAVIVDNNNWHFWGILSNPYQSANHLAQIRQGYEGKWLFEFRYTPEENPSVGLFVFYTLLGHMARTLGLSQIVVFHLARVASSLFMFMAFYHLSASVWQRLRPRRLFFWLISIGSGLGWLLLIIFPDALSADLSVPAAFPLYAAYTNPHFPLSIGGLTFLASFFVNIFRPGYDEAPKLENGGLTIILLSLLVVSVLPSALIAFATSLAIFILITAYIERKFPWHEIRWATMVWAPALPIAFYLFLILRSTDFIEAFVEQVFTPAPNIILFLIGYSGFLLLAAPGLYRASRRFERDSDQLMFIWLVFNVIIIFIPSPLQGRLLIGLIIPLTFFVVRSIEDFWVNQINPKRHTLFITALFVLLIPTNILALIIPLYGAVFNRDVGAKSSIVVPQDYHEALEWLDENGIEGEVVLASPEISLWVPVATPLRVVYGHPFETVPAETREMQVENFFSGSDCQTLLNTNDFNVDYVLWGSYEKELQQTSETTTTSCLEAIYAKMDIDLDEATCSTSENRIRCFGDVKLYILRELR